MARRIGSFFIALLVFLGLFVSGLLFWATSESGSHFISGKLRTQLKKDTGLDVSFQDIDLDLLPPRIQVREIYASDNEKLATCTVEEAEFSPRALELFAGILNIEEVYLGAPSCTIRLGEAEIDKLVEIFEKQSEDTEPTKLRIELFPSFDVFAVSSGSLNLIVADPSRLGDMDFQVTGFGLDVTGGTPSIEVRGLVEKAHIAWRLKDDTIDESLTDLRFRTAVSNDAIDIRHLQAVIAKTVLNMRDAYLPLPLWPQGPDVADFSVEIPLDLFNRLPLDLPAMGGSAGFVGQLSAAKDTNGKIGYSARGQASLDDAFVDDFVIGDLNGLVSLTPRGVAFDKTKISTASGTLNAKGHIAFDDSLTTEVRLRLDKIELGQLLEQVTVKGAYVTQRMSGPITLKGKLNPLHLDGNLHLDILDHILRNGSFRSHDPPVILHIPKTDLRGRISITAHGLEAHNLVVASGDTTLDVDVRFDFDQATWRLYTQTEDFHAKDVKKILNFEVGGHGPLTCLIEGPLDNPHITGKLDFENFMLDGKQVDSAKTQVSYAASILSFSQLEIKSDNGTANAPELRLDFTPKKGLHIATKVNAEKISIGNLFRLFRINPSPYGSPSGRLSGQVALDYYSEADKFDVDFDLRHNLLTLYGERFGTDVLRGSWNDGDLMVTAFGLKKETGTISITGAMLKDRTISFIGIASDIESKSITNQDFRKLKIDTSLQAFVILEGNLEHPTGSADIRIGHTVARKVHYGPTNLQLELDGDLLSGSGQIAENTAMVKRFFVNLNSKRFEFASVVNNFDLLGLMDVGARNKNASMPVAGDLSLMGRFDKEPDLSGQINLSKVQITLDDFAFENLRPLSIRVDKSQFKIKNTRFKGQNIVFDLKGGLGLETLNLKVIGAANLVAVKSLVDVFDKSDGIVNFEISARGPVTSPSLSGNATIKDSSVRVKKFPYHIEQINGEIFVTPKAIRFTDFSAKVADGTVDVNGEVLLKKDVIAIDSYLFNLYAKEVKLALIDDLTFTASTTKDGLTLKSPRNEDLPKITGDVEIRDLRYTQDIRVLEMSDLSMDRLSGARVRTRKPKVIDKKNDFFAFDVQLHGKRNLEARNNLFDMDLTIDDVDRPLRLVGTNQNLGFLGRVLGKRGQVRFGGKRFDIKYADVDFQDPDRPDNPNFRVTADGQIRDWKVTITAEGTIEEYELKLSSQPYLSQEDVIFVILTGMTKAENRQFGAATLTPLLSQLGPGGKSIPVEFRIYNAYSEQAGTETTRIALGRWITPDIWVSVSSSVSQERDVEAELDYKINDQFSISSDYQDDNEGSVGNIGLDLKFRLEF